jgi:membrane protein YqaA with SNARE-associated domain
MKTKKILTIIGIIFLIISIGISLYYLINDKPIPFSIFLVMSYVSHIFFLVIIPLELYFFQNIKFGVSPILLIICLSILAEIALITNYYISKQLSHTFLKKYIGDAKYKKYKKLYSKFGNYILVIAAATPFAPVPILTLFEGFFDRSLKNMILLTFFGILLKWSMLFLLFEQII